MFADANIDAQFDVDFPTHKQRLYALNQACWLLQYFEKFFDAM